MKLFKPKSKNEFFIPTSQWLKVGIAVSSMTLIVFIIAAICSACGVNIFIMNYQNETLNNIESFFKENKIYALIETRFLTVETTIGLFFICKSKRNILGAANLYALIVMISAFNLNLPSIVYTLITTAFVFLVPLAIYLANRTYNYKKMVIKALIYIGVTFVLEFLVSIIKSGGFNFSNPELPLSTYFIYHLEYELALIIILATLGLCIEEKGAIKSWITSQEVGGSSQTLRKNSQKQKLLTKKQKNKIFFIYVKTYLLQFLTFGIVIILPFLVGKPLEFFLMYISFCLVRYILGFKYSLHFTKEIYCIITSVVTFGVITLVVPFFYINVIAALLFGSGLALILHFSYQYKSFKLFIFAANKDRYAELYVYFNGNTTDKYISTMGKHYGLNDLEVKLLIDYMNHEKLSYLAEKYNYSLIYINNLLDKIIDKISLTV